MFEKHLTAGRGLGVTREPTPMRGATCGWRAGNTASTDRGWDHEGRGSCKVQGAWTEYFVEQQGGSLKCTCCRAVGRVLAAHAGSSMKPANSTTAADGDSRLPAAAPPHFMAAAPRGPSSHPSNSAQPKGLAVQTPDTLERSQTISRRGSGVWPRRQAAQLLQTLCKRDLKSQRRCRTLPTKVLRCCRHRRRCCTVFAQHLAAASLCRQV